MLAVKIEIEAEAVFANFSASGVKYVRICCIGCAIPNAG